MILDIKVFKFSELDVGELFVLDHKLLIKIGDDTAGSVFDGCWSGEGCPVPLPSDLRVSRIKKMIIELEG